MILKYEIRVDDDQGGLPDDWRGIKAVADAHINDACAGLARAFWDFTPALHISVDDHSDVPS